MIKKKIECKEGIHNFIIINECEYSHCLDCGVCQCLNSFCGIQKVMSE